MRNALALNCLVSGDDTDHIFTIEIPNAKNVSALKKAIKAEKQLAFQHIDADTLVLWNVSLPVDESLKDNLRNFVGENPLLPLHKLSKVFSNVDETDLHIVVGRPHGACKCHSLAIFLPDFLAVPRLSDPPLLEINCLVLGEPRTHIFPVAIAPTKTVGALKKAIKIEKMPAFDHVPADTLILWKVSIPVDDSLGDNLRNLVDEQSLSPVEALSEVFTSSPDRKHLHIIVKPPPVGES